MTKVRVPEFKVLDYRDGIKHHGGWYQDSMYIEFKTVPSDELFNKIDRMIETDDSVWERNGDVYSMSVMWHYFTPSPDDDETDKRFFGIKMSRGEKKGIITHGELIRAAN